jgi:NADH-quinone oxidoreductase subunit K
LGVLLNYKNVLIILLGVEFFLLIINIVFISTSIFIDDIYGQVYSLLILTVAAAESAIGLAILLSYYKVRGTITIHDNILLKN